MNDKKIKIIGTVTSIATLGLTIVSGWVGEQKLDNLVEKKVNEALALQREEF